MGRCRSDPPHLTIRAENTKTNAARAVPISQKLYAVLQLIRQDPAGNDHPVAAFVFGNAIGAEVAFPKKQWDTARLRAHGHDPQWAGSKLSKTSRAQLKQINLRFHDLRHEAGSRWSDAGWPIAHVQAMLGHRDLTMTSVYVNTLLLRQLQASMKTFEAGESLHSVAQKPAIAPQPDVQDGGAQSPKVVVN